MNDDGLSRKRNRIRVGDTLKRKVKGLIPQRAKHDSFSGVHGKKDTFWVDGHSLRNRKGRTLFFWQSRKKSLMSRKWMETESKYFNFQWTKDVCCQDGQWLVRKKTVYRESQTSHICKTLVVHKKLLTNCIPLNYGNSHNPKCPRV